MAKFVRERSSTWRLGC